MKHKLAVAGGLLLFFVMLGVLIGKVTPAPWGDGVWYFEMAKQPLEFVGSPWGYRIGVPYSAVLVSSLTGIELVSAFAAVRLVMFAMVMTLSCLWMLYGLRLRGLIVSLAALLFLTSPGATYNLYNMWVIGFAESLLLLMGVIAIYHKRYSYLAWVVGVSVLFKESIGMLLIPTYALTNVRAGQLSRAARRTSLLLTVFAAAFFVLRSGVIFRGDNGFGSYSAYLSEDYLGLVYEGWGGLAGALSHTLFSFGPLWLLAGWGLWVAPRRFKPLALVQLLAVMQILLATDVERMVASGSPVTVAFCAFALSATSTVRAVLIALACSAYGVIHLFAPEMSGPAFLGTGAIVLALLTVGPAASLLRTANRPTS